MKKNRIYTIEVDAELDSKLKAFTKQLSEGEEIVSQVVAGNKLIITTRQEEYNFNKPKNLLLEELRKNR